MSVAMKNDFVLRRIFATHPDILRGLLKRWMKNALTASTAAEVFA